MKLANTSRPILFQLLMVLCLALPVASQGGGISQGIVACGSVGADHDVGGQNLASAGQPSAADAKNAALNSIVPDKCGNCEAPPHCPQTDIWDVPAG